MSKKFDLQQFKKERGLDKLPKKLYGVVYLIVQISTNKYYVGKTTRHINERFKQHMGSNKSLIGQQVKLKGKQDFHWFLLDRCYSEGELANTEIFYIKYLNTLRPFGFNKVLSSSGPKVPWNKGLKGTYTNGRKGIPNYRSRKPLIATNIKTGEEIEYPCSLIPGFNSGHIIQCCKGNLPYHKGFKWRYKNV